MSLELCAFIERLAAIFMEALKSLGLMCQRVFAQEGFIFESFPTVLERANPRPLLRAAELLLVFTHTARQ